MIVVVEKIDGDDSKGVHVYIDCADKDVEDCSCKLAVLGDRSKHAVAVAVEVGGRVSVDNFALDRELWLMLNVSEALDRCFQDICEYLDESSLFEDVSSNEDDSIKIYVGNDVDPIDLVYRLRCVALMVLRDYDVV